MINKTLELHRYTKKRKLYFSNFIFMRIFNKYFSCVSDKWVVDGKLLSHLFEMKNKPFALSWFLQASLQAVLIEQNRVWNFYIHTSRYNNSLLDVFLFKRGLCWPILHLCRPILYTSIRYNYMIKINYQIKSIINLCQTILYLCRPILYTSIR